MLDLIFFTIYIPVKSTFSSNAYGFVADVTSLQIMTSQRGKQKRFGVLTQTA